MYEDDSRGKVQKQRGRRERGDHDVDVDRPARVSVGV